MGAYERAAYQLRASLLPPSQYLFTLERVAVLHYDHSAWPLWRQLGYTALLFLLELAITPLIFVLGFAEFGLRACFRPSGTPSVFRD